MKIAVGADHRGFKQKELILAFYEQYHGVTMVDVGAYDDKRSDYPIYAHKVIDLLCKKEVDLGILLCGSGIGMAITANRTKGIYAGVVWNQEIAQNAREHDNVNVLVLPSDYVADEDVIGIVTTWAKASFFGGRYQERLELIDDK